MSSGEDKLVRTSITLQASLKEMMLQTSTNWSEAIREMVAQRLQEGQTDMAEAIVLNEWFEATCAEELEQPQGNQAVAN